MVKLEQQHKTSTNNQTPSSGNKLTIAKEKLCDEDFDRLVIDTSHRVTSEEISLIEEQQHQSSSSSSSVGCCSSPKLADIKADNNDNEKVSPSNSSFVSSSLVSDQNVTQDSSASSCDFDNNNNNRTCQFRRFNQPKRPMNAFMVWGQAIRRNLHLRFSNVQNALLSKALGRVWRSLDAAEKEPYVRKANIIKANHKRDYPDYRYQPRRIHERRSKSNMLIGIQLNHPVNEQPKRMSAFVSPTAQSSYGNSFDYELNSQQQSDTNAISSFSFNNKKNNDSMLASNQSTTTTTNSTYGGNNVTATSQEYLVREGKHVDGVQTFEYQPYQSSTKLNFNNNEICTTHNNELSIRDNYNFNNNTGPCGLNYNNNNNNNNNESMNHHQHGQQQAVCVVRSKVPTSTSTYAEPIDSGYYSTCNSQFSTTAYNNIIHHHHHNQPQQDQFNNTYQSLSFSSNSVAPSINASVDYSGMGKQPISYYEHPLNSTSSSHQNNHHEMNKHVQEYFFRPYEDSNYLNNGTTTATTTIQFNNNLI